MKPVEISEMPTNTAAQFLRKTPKGDKSTNFCKTFRFLLCSQVKACYNSRDQTDDGSKYDRARKLQEYDKEAEETINHE